MALNPLAAEFVPSALRKESRQPYTGWGRDGTSRRTGAQEFHTAELRGGFVKNKLQDFPREIIAVIFSKLQNPADALAAALANKWIMQVASEAPTRFRATALQLQPPNHSFLTAVGRIFPGVAELDLSGCSHLEDAEVAVGVRNLSHLQVLDLSGCRKLSSVFVWKALADSRRQANQLRGGEDSSQNLRVLGLQRCFQMDSETLSDVLCAAASTLPDLSTVTLSHLSLAEWPTPESSSPKLRMPHPTLPRMPMAHGIKTTSLKILALHNCKSVAADGLAYLAACCPDLEMLLLGGSSLDVPVRSAEDGETPPGHPERVAQIGSQVLWGIGSLEGFHKRRTAALVDATAGLSKLQVLELTFYFPKVVASAAAQMPGIQVWDFTNSASVEAAERLYAEHKGKASFSGIALALSAAANCSSSARHTPLHAAVDADCKQSIKVLLKLGGQIEARDQSGATPLFLACETNRRACADILIRAGAELRTRNSGGEAPLYIAALRGHDNVVELLLAAFHERGLKWTEVSLYGDRWNPLMAAAVADRHAIAVRLLRAAGPEAGNLVVATNRYGQSAGHIAARKGSYMMLTALINAAGNIVAAIPDTDHKTPLGVAKAHKHEAAVALLQNAMACFAEETRRQSVRPGRWPSTLLSKEAEQWMIRNAQSRGQHAYRS